MSARVIRSEAELARLLARPGFRVASQFGGECVNTDTSSIPEGRERYASPAHCATSASGRNGERVSNAKPVAGIKSGPLTLPCLPGDAPDTEPPADPRVAPQATFLPLREMRFTLPMPPSVNALYGVNHRTGQKFLLDEQRRFRSVVIGLVKGRMLREEQRAKPLLGRVQLVAAFHFADRRRSDVSNRVKALEDALTHAGAYRDDSQIDDLRAYRIVGHGEERCEVVLTEIAA